MKTIILGTQNPGKIKEFFQTPLAQFLKPLPEGLDDPEETQTTCEGNALLKAEYYSQILKAPVLSDDSGFFIEALDGFPGVQAARYIRQCGSRQAAFDDLELKIRQSSNLRCYFQSTLAFVDPSQGVARCFTGKLWGRLCFPARGKRGFGYDPICIADGTDKTLAEIDSEQKNTISHRSRALEQFFKWFNSSYALPTDKG